MAKALGLDTRVCRFKYLFTDKAMLGSTLGTFPNEIKSHQMWRCASQPSSERPFRKGPIFYSQQDTGRRQDCTHSLSTAY